MLIEVDETAIREKVTWLTNQAEKYFIQKGGPNWATDMYASWLAGILYVVTPAIISKEESALRYARIREFRTSDVKDAVKDCLDKLENLDKPEDDNEN